MAKNILFSFNPQGQLAYRKTGRIAPSSYHVGTGSRASTVYGPDGRKVGTVSRTIPDAKTKRARQKAKTKAKAKAKTAPKAEKKKAKPKEAKKISAATAEDELLRKIEKAEFTTTEDPEKSEKVIEEFADSVRHTLEDCLPEKLVPLVWQLQDRQIWAAYQANVFAFEVFFLYSGKSEEDAERTARWVLGLIQRIGRE